MLVRVIKGRLKKDGSYVDIGMTCELTDEIASSLINSGVVEPTEDDDFPGTPLTTMSCMTPNLAAVLTKAGYSSVEAVYEASAADLVALKSIGEATAERLLAEAEELLED